MTALKVAKSKPAESTLLQPSEEVTLATKNLLTVQSTCEAALKYKRLIGLCGEPGFGKTVALKFFQTQNKNVFFITVKPSMKEKTFWLELMQMVCSRTQSCIKISQSQLFNYNHRSLYFILKKICEGFNGLENPLLILDEAGKLTVQMLLNLHEVRDATMHNLGIIIAGPNYFKDNLNYWASRKKQGIPELMTRINSWIELETPTYFEFKRICVEYGINDPEIIKAIVYKTDDFRTLHSRITNYIIENTP